MLDREFTAYFNSKDSADRFDNTLSSFTCEFDVPIDFGGFEYEVGVSDLSLNPSVKSLHKSNQSRDLINLSYSKTKSENIFTLETFSQFVILHALSPELYSPQYFHQYLDDNYFFDDKSIRKDFGKDITEVEDEGKEVTLKIDLSAFLEGSETLKDFIPKHSSISAEVMKDVAISIQADKTLSMFQVLNKMLRGLGYKLRKLSLGDAYIDGHARLFFNAFNSYADSEVISRLDKKLDSKMKRDKILKLVNDERRKHLNLINRVMHRIIKRFVTSISEAIIENNFGINGFSKYIYIYSNIIGNQICGSKRLKLLFATPFEGRNGINYHEQSIVNIHFCGIEKQSVKSISFLLLDEYGQQIDFLPSHHQNMITLRFRRIQN